MLISLTQHSCNLNNEWEGYYANTPARIDDNVFELIGDEQDFSRFHDLLLQYGFEDLLSQDQYFTLFVPVNSAFEGIPEYSDDEWRKIIGFHILYSKLFSYDFSDASLLTIIGKFLNMLASGDQDYSIFDSRINMENVDNYCQNGVIHEIDQLLLPRPNMYEYIMALDSSYSILQDFLNSMDEKYIDYEKSERIGVDDNGNAVYDTVWLEENYYLDHVAGLNNETESFTGFIPSNEDVRIALEEVSGYFGNIRDLEKEAIDQLLFLTFSGSFVEEAYTFESLPDTVYSVSGKKVDKTQLTIAEGDLEVSNGLVNLLDAMTIPKSYFLLPIFIECDRKENRTVSNTVYPIEVLGDSRATNGSYVGYNCQFVGDFLQFEVDMVLKTKYWIVWTGPKQGPSHYQISVRNELTGDWEYVGPPVNNWTKGAFVLVVSGIYEFQEFGSKQVRITIVDEAPLPGFNSIFVDYIKLVPDEIYDQ
ncbi:MAG: fasciclin domain-containing protein [Bacteroidales bacterium]